MQRYLPTWRVSALIATRDIARGNWWASGLIIFLIALTFMNLVVVGGVLVGLIESSSRAHRLRQSSDILISPLTQKSYIERSQTIIGRLKTMPEITALTARYVESGTILAGYKTQTNPKEKTDRANALIVGIKAAEENKVTKISEKIVEGRFLRDNDFGKIVLGSNLLRKYLPIDSPGLETLEIKGVGEKVRLVVNGQHKEMEVIGIIKSKVGEIDQRAFVNAAELRLLIGRNDLNVDEIAIKVADGVDVELVKTKLQQAGFDKLARIKTWSEAQPKFIQDIKNTFALLGNIIGSIGVIASSITIFIIIFINAIVRRKQIGILKAIGITSNAIELAYVLQAFFYALIGIGIGAALTFLLIKPYIDAHPINFPFSDGILAITWQDAVWRFAVLLIATLGAGYIPAKIVVRKNTINSILGR